MVAESKEVDGDMITKAVLDQVSDLQNFSFVDSLK